MGEGSQFVPRLLLIVAALLSWSPVGCRSGERTGPSESLRAGELASGRSADAPSTQPDVRSESPTTQPASAPATQPDLTVELSRLKAHWLKELGAGHSAAIRSPYLLVANSEQRWADYYLRATVMPATVRIEKQFMKARPNRPMVVLLFLGQPSYRKACKEVLAVADPPYYGFYQPWRRLLVMDIKTGGGTLVHELTHALIAFDFADIPDWFNEGLGSLYEQCSFSDGRITGLVNWRLPALQKAIANDTLGSFAELTKKEFRRGAVGLNYAQARYLCLYMQKLGLLEKFYVMFRDGYEQDHTGLSYLRKVFGPRSLEDVEQDWRRWVGTLKWPPRGR